MSTLDSILQLLNKWPAWTLQKHDGISEADIRRHRFNQLHGLVDGALGADQLV